MCFECSEISDPKWDVEVLTLKATINRNFIDEEKGAGEIIPDHYSLAMSSTPHYELFSNSY